MGSHLLTLELFCGRSLMPRRFLRTVDDHRYTMGELQSNCKEPKVPAHRCNRSRFNAAPFVAAPTCTQPLSAVTRWEQPIPARLQLSWHPSCYGRAILTCATRGRVARSDPTKLASTFRAKLTWSLICIMQTLCHAPKNDGFPRVPPSYARSYRPSDKVIGIPIWHAPCILQTPCHAREPKKTDLPASPLARTSPWHWRSLSRLRSATGIGDWVSVARVKLAGA